MRVAIFTETFLPKIDGIVTVVRLLLDHLDQRGIDYIVVSPRLGATAYNGHPVISAPGITFPFYPELRVGPPTPGVYQTVKAFNPDVMHFIHPILVGAGGVWMARWLKKATLASFHLDIAGMTNHFGMGFLNPLTWAFTRLNFNLCDYALAPSKLVQEEMLERGIKNVGLWKRGVDAERFHPRHRNPEMRSLLSDGHPEDTILLYVGRLSPEKQIENLRPILENVAGARLAVVGDGPHREILETYFTDLPVKFMGYMTGEPLLQAYASADIFTFPSALETFGLVLTEAMAAGLPVVTTLVGGARDVVKPGVTGYAVPVGDIEGMIASVQVIAGENGRRDYMGKAARAFAETQTWEAMMDEVVQLYHILMAGQKPVPVLQDTSGKLSLTS